MLFWNHDPVQRDWHVYGEGKVAADGKTIVPAANVGIYQFSGFMASPPNDPPPNPCTTACCSGPGGPPPGPGPGSPYAGDPVNCGTGEFIHTNTDLRLARVWAQRTPTCDSPAIIEALRVEIAAAARDLLDALYPDVIDWDATTGGNAGQLPRLGQPASSHRLAEAPTMAYYANYVAWPQRWIHAYS